MLTDDEEFDRLVAIGKVEADGYVSWLERNTNETLSPFARRALAHTFALTCAHEAPTVRPP